MKSSPRFLSTASLAALALCTTTAYAEPRLPREEACRNIHNLAKTIMERRQEGAPMPVIMDSVGDNELFQAMVETAYDSRRYATEPMQQRAVEDFANDFYSECWKNY